LEGFDESLNCCKWLIVRNPILGEPARLTYFSLICKVPLCNDLTIYNICIILKYSLNCLKFVLINDINLSAKAIKCTLEALLIAFQCYAPINESHNHKLIP